MLKRSLSAKSPSIKIVSFLLVLFVAPFAVAQSTRHIDLKHVAAIREKIKSNIVYAEKGERLDNPSASFDVRVFPDGEVLTVKKIKSSGNLEYDAAIERSIWKSSPLPTKEDGTLERDLTLSFTLRGSH